MRWIPFIILLIVLQWYAFQALKTLTQNKIWWVGHPVLTILSVGLLL